MDSSNETKSENIAKVLEQKIQESINKIGATKEKDLCHYLPMPTGEGYMHHFTMRKMKTENPRNLVQLLEELILYPEQPKQLPPKARAPRGTRKKEQRVNLTKEDLNRMLQIAQIAGDKEMIAKLTPSKSLKQVKNELIRSIRQNQVDLSLWESYVNTVNNLNLNNHFNQI